MKKLIALTIAAIGVLGMAPASAANPQVMFTQATGAPISGVPTYKAGDIAYFVIANFPATPEEGVYIYQAVQPAAGEKPTQKNAGGAIWVSTQQGATFAPTAILAVKIDNGNSWGADCAHQQCGLWVEGAHGTVSAAQQFVAFNFEGGATPAPSSNPTPMAAPLPKDSVSVKINGAPAAPNGLGTIHYREVLKFSATSAANAAISYKSYTPTLCPVTATGEVTALKGTGQCDIAVVSAATATTAASESHFPFQVAPGVQSLASTKASLKVGKSATLATISNFGETVSYKNTTTKICTLKGSGLKVLKVGSCVLTATAPASSNYPALNEKVIIKVTK